MTIFRNPILTATLPKALDCVGAECIKRRIELKPGRQPDGSFRCPGHAQGRCERKSFCYPRSRRTGKKLATYLSQRGLKKLPDELQYHFHQGIDLGTMRNPIISVVRGTVVRVVNSYTKGFGNYGKCIIVRADDSYGAQRGLHFFHAHCDEIVAQESALVQERELIAYSGATDYNEKDPTASMPVEMAHLHFEVSAFERDSKPFFERSPQYEEIEALEGRPVRCCLNPLQVLVNGEAATRPSLEKLSTALLHEEGGYFPIGSNSLWHGGVHLLGKRGSALVAPMAGEIVACRLGESDETTLLTHGSINFILMRHEVRKELEPRTGAERKAKETPRDVLKAGASHPLVPEVKKMLSAILDASSGQPYYQADQATLDSEAFDEALKISVMAFQKLFLRTPDGEITVGGTTWSNLRQRAYPAQPEPEGEDKPPDHKWLYTLLMHLDARPIERMASRAKWLTRAQVKAEPAPEARARAGAGAGTRAEHRYSGRPQLQDEKPRRRRATA